MDEMFLPHLVPACCAIAEHVLIVYGSHLYDGTPDDIALYHLRPYLNRYPGVLEARQYNVDPQDVSDPFKYHNIARYTGRCFMRDTIEWMLFLDADEIPDSKEFLAWWESTRDTLNRNTAYKLANYWYFWDATLRAKQYEDSIVLAHRSICTYTALHSNRDRDGIVLHAPYNRRMVCGLNARPMFRHYSWVRQDKAQLLRKVECWGHRTDKNWKALIESFERGDMSRDFVHGYQLEKDKDALSFDQSSVR